MPVEVELALPKKAVDISKTVFQYFYYLVF